MSLIVVAANPWRTTAGPGQRLRQSFLARCNDVWRGLQAVSGYSVTPVRTLPLTARALGLGQVLLKDESTRFAVGNFKTLGTVAALRLIAATLSPRDRPTVACASDGNYGVALAWAARQYGLPCRVFLPHTVFKSREQDVRHYRGRPAMVQGNYDDAVCEVRRQSARRGWTLVSDTAHRGYTRIPRAVGFGYSAMMCELARQIRLDEVSHVFVQCGVGTFAAAITDYLSCAGLRRIRVVTVESVNAAGIFSSGRHGRLTTIRGDLQTQMAGLACGRPSPAAWPSLRVGASHFATLDDAAVDAAFRFVDATAAADGMPVLGATGIAGFAALLVAAGDSRARRQLGLANTSSVLLFGTEGVYSRANVTAT